MPFHKGEEEKILMRRIASALERIADVLEKSKPPSVQEASLAHSLATACPPLRSED